MRIAELEKGLPDGVILKHVILHHNKVKMAEAIYIDKVIRYDADGKCQDKKGNRLPELDIRRDDLT